MKLEPHEHWPEFKEPKPIKLETVNDVFFNTFTYWIKVIVMSLGIVTIGYFFIK